MLNLAYSLALLSPTPVLLHPVLCALDLPPFEWCLFLADPSVSKDVIKIKQQFGEKSIWPLFKFGRAIILSMHRTRMRLINLWLLSIVISNQCLLVWLFVSQSPPPILMWSRPVCIVNTNVWLNWNIMDNNGLRCYKIFFTFLVLEMLRSAH